jgi:glutathione peroxidase
MSLYDVEVEEMSGLITNLNEYKGKVMLIVNTASKCGYTPQLEGLQKLYKNFKEEGFEILAFPCGQFLNQELDTNTEIVDFCKANYGVSFPIYAKTFVRGRKQTPLYKYLLSHTPVRKKKKIKWNFEKFLINRDGTIINRYSPKILPEELVEDIKEQL